MKTIFIVVTVLLGVGIYAILSGSSVQELLLDVIYYLIPLFIGTFILAKFGKDESARCIGILSLKPMFTFLFFGLMGGLELYEELYNFYPYNLVRAILWLFPELFLTIIVGYSFKTLVQKDKAVLLFFIGDIVRWLAVFISLSFPDPIPEPYFYWQLYVGVIFALFMPPLYAVTGLVLTIRRAKVRGIQLEPESTPSQERSEINSVSKRIFISADHGMAITARTSTSVLSAQSRLKSASPLERALSD